MTKFLSSLPVALLLSACASPSGLPAAAIVRPAIAAAYLPLSGRVHLGLDRAAGAAVVVAPGIAATCAHNANLVDPGKVIGTVRDYDLLYFRDGKGVPPAMAQPVVGSAVTAYGQDNEGGLRRADGVVAAVVTCAGCTAPAYFTFSNPRRGADDAGPGFSGGPVVDASGRLVGIVFGYKDEGPRRLIYAYDMARVKAELSRLGGAVPPARNSQARS